MTAPISTAELREALAAALYAGASHGLGWSPDLTSEIADVLIAGPLSSLLAERDAAIDFVSRHPSLNETDRAEFRGMLKLAVILRARATP